MRLLAVVLILTAAPAAAAPVPKAPPADPVGRGYLGIYFAEGALAIDRVEPGGPAARAGLLAGDVFVRVGPVEPRERTQMQQLLVGLRPGSLILVTVRRGDEEKTVVVRLGARPDRLDYYVPDPTPPGPP